ncbi:DUF2779 domain-containing protein [Mycoplasma suis]|uniref:DUF2779 domain-containing protein n=1 Tax=Mycoplasma suis (strain Illinois) TaxID=768700 RepID=F0QRB5_MYCSL|nr:DUF2779 domain-containing protein [Mycoplasma suis]ADX98035.1 conserved hypothetical protein [Mycoplasma suis str. Illinois]
MGGELQKEKLNSELKSNEFDFFLSYYFCKKVFAGTKISSSAIFSHEGKKELNNRIVSIEWKVYYDFESYSEMLTQASFQIYQLNNLVVKEDLIFNPEKDYSSFEEECVIGLARPLIIITIMSGINLKEFNSENLLSLSEKLSKQVVYIAFNKTFECTWLQKLAERMTKSENSILSLLIKDLTVDLCDWFIFSKNKSLNLIGELQGTHSLKRLSTKVLKDMKQYSSLECVQEGRGAQFLFLYYFFILKYQGFSKTLLNDELSPKHWVKDYKEKLSKTWENIKRYLTEYCSLDVQGMVWAVDWLRHKYESEKLVDRELIQDFISWIKAKNPSELKILISEYLALSPNI